MKQLLYIFILSLVFCSCTTQKHVEYRDRDIIHYVTQIQRDTIIQNTRDSIFTNIYVKGDTIYNIKYKEKTIYKDKIVNRTDTIYRDNIVTEYKEIEKIKTKTPNWCWILLSINILIFIFATYKLIRKWRS